MAGTASDGSDLLMFPLCLSSGFQKTDMEHHQLVVQGESHLLTQFSFYFHRLCEFQLFPLQDGDQAYPMLGHSHQSKINPWETIAKGTYDQWFLLVLAIKTCFWVSITAPRVLKRVLDNKKGVAPGTTATFKRHP